MYTKKSFTKILILVSLVFLLNSCLGYKIVKEEEKVVEAPEEKTYQKWSVWDRFNREIPKEEIKEEEEKKVEEKIEIEEEIEKVEDKIKEEDKEKQEEEKKIEENKKEKKVEKKEVEKEIFDYSKLSAISEFWEAVVKWNGIISKINYNLYVKEETSDFLDDIDTENLNEFFSYNGDEEIKDLTKYIKNQYNIFYWNTARVLPWNKGFTFFVIHENKWNYIYEKHYVDLKNKLHWILFLDKWPLEKAENIEEKLESLKTKNKELKEMNSEFSEIPTTNIIFKKLLK